MQYVKQRLQKVNLKLVLGATVTVGLLAFALLKLRAFRKQVKPTTRQKSQLISQISKDTVEFDGPRQKDFARVINATKNLIPKTGKLNLEAIKAIYIAQHELSRHAFEIVMRKNRIVRRNIISDLNAYRQKVMQLEYEIQDLHNHNLDAILAYFKIDKREWYETVEEISQKESEQWEVMILETEESQLDALRDKNRQPITMTDLVKMCLYKTEIIQELVNEMKGLCKDSDRNEVFSLLDRRMSDLLYLKYNVEQQDINYSLSKLSKEEHRVLEGIEQKVEQVLRNLIQQLSLD